ncbi:MAG TPA: DUF4226 domain-containing protein [Mycobacterium sp.]|uniref:DUF4226 domain-containing protein n=1 Tax=Mycobacterium sp. TaxID=1785 RepID=UPI002B6D6D73|nr:DUF4226 domain-containing protein [Mycobacterium sp.]HME75260.1 DUF4226 domain-containing protein [Mycobacterium sp.]
MATPGDVLAAVEHVKQCTGDPKAWLSGLTRQDVTDVVTVFGASPQRLDGVIARIRQHHPDLFDPRTGETIVPRPTGPAGPGPQSDRQEGEAADAIRDAEAALAHQNSTTAQVDLQVVTAVLNAHQKNAEGREALNRLQHDIEAAVTTRSDLDTPAGARDFQRFLIGKLRDIRAVVANASLDDTSNSALMAAWTSLYNLDNVAKPETRDADQHRPSTVASAGSPPESVGQSPPPATDTGPDPYLDSLPAGDPGLLPEAMPAQTPSAATPLPPEMPSIPSFGGGGMPGFGMPGGFPLPEPLHGADDVRSPKDLDDALLDADDPEDSPSADKDGDGQPDDHDAESTASHPPATGPTTVTLPNGETVTAANPQLAAAIKAAAGGTPIADAFRQEGISIPPPGTAVADPVDPSRLTPGDIGMLTDRHALALGQSRALLNGQIQHISTVNGPSFLGWEHPPGPVTPAAPDRTDPPAPTRPATAGRPLETT